MERLNNLQKKITPFKSLKHRDYRLFIIGFFIAQLSFQMQVIAINWHVYQLTKSALSLGLVGFYSFLPIMVFSLFGGLVADKMDRKRLLILSQVGLGVLALVLSFWTFLGIISPSLIYLIIFLEFTVMAFFAPVRQSIIPSLVPEEDLLNAISLNTLARQGATVIGPSIAGFLIAFHGVGSVYLLNGIFLILTLGTILPIKLPQLLEKKVVVFKLISIIEGILFLRKSPILKSTMLLDFFVTFFGSATALLPIFAVEILNTDAKGLGILYAATSVGGVIAGLALSSLNHIKAQGRLIVYSVVLYGLATIGFGLSKSFYLTCFFLIIIGVADMVSTILRNTIRQVITPDHLRGRLTGINIFFAQSGPKLGEAEAGLLASITSAPFSVVLGGAGSLISAALILKNNPDLMKFKSSEVSIKD